MIDSQQPSFSQTLLICNAQVVLPNETLTSGAILIEEGHIAGICDETFPAVDAKDTIDALGKVLMPGIIDMHTDAMDVEIVPRPGADFPIAVAFRELEKKMVSCGFTTVYHALHYGYQTAVLNAKSKYSREEVIEKIRKLTYEPSLIRHKIHLRYELPGVEVYEGVSRYIRQGDIDLFSIMDHTPGQGQFSAPQQFINELLQQGMLMQEAKEQLTKLQQREKVSGEKLENLIQLAIAHNIPVASHDDDSPQKVDYHQQLGIRICEFPINLSTAQSAKDYGMHIVGGSSNILRGGSLSGNLNVREAISQECINMLCSDYYPPSIIHAIFSLANEGVLPLHKAVQLATLRPAQAVGVHRHTGSITVGKYADLLLVDTSSNAPFITHTLVEGRVVYQSSIPKKLNFAYEHTNRG